MLVNNCAPGSIPWVIKLKLNKTRMIISSTRRHGRRIMMGPKNIDQHMICIEWECAFTGWNGIL